MPLSIITYNIDPAMSMTRSVQAATPEQMELRLAVLLAEITALNALIPDDLDKWMPADGNLAGAGDGHTFVFTVTFVRTRCNRVINVLLGVPGGVINENTVFIPISDFTTRFWLASESEALDLVMNRVLDELAASSDPEVGGSLAVWQQVAGATQGTRFMGGVTVLSVPPPEQPQ
jgi:hypothetical protein